jgi:hypothetical protein
MNEDTQSTEEETVVCIGCAKPMPRHADFCPHCGAPNGPYCWYDPWKRIFASGHVYRRVVSKPLSRFAVLGVLLLLVFMIVALLFGAIEISKQSDPGDSGRFVPMIGTMVIVGILVFFMRRVVLNYLRRQETKKRCSDV